MNIFCPKNGNENGMLFSNEIMGGVYIAERLLRRFITNDMQKEILEMSPLVGSSPFAKPAMNPFIIKFIKGSTDTLPASSAEVIINLK